MNEIRVLHSAQRLVLLKDGCVAAQYIVSTSSYGPGELEGSKKTPLGRHEIAEKMGSGEPKGAVFMGRKATGEVYTSEFAQAQPGRDWILSRILWLNGLEDGRNRGGVVDTKSRYIYIHGTHEEEKIGRPVSHGCIRMLNDDVIGLFELVDIGTPVGIVE